MKENILSINNLNFSYKKQKVLNNVSFSINRGDFIAILGDSGCGKSTLLRLIAGFLKASSGEILYKNKLHNSPNVNIGVMFQNSPLYPWLNLFDNIAFGPKMMGKPKNEIKEIVNKYLHAVDLVGVEKKYPYQCSGGMRSRAFLAKVLANDSEIILMDEPFSALDSFSRASMQNLMRNIWFEFKKTVILITHDIDEALSLATKIIVMKPCHEDKSNIINTFRVNFTNKIKSIEVLRDRGYLDLKETLNNLIQDRNYEYVI